VVAHLEGFTGYASSGYSFYMLMMSIRAVVHESLLRDMPPDVIEWGGRVKYTRNGRRCNGRSQFRECGFRHRWRWGTKCCSRGDFWGQISCRIRVSVHEIRGDFVFLIEFVYAVQWFDRHRRPDPFNVLTPMPARQHSTESVTMACGSPGFFGYSPCSPNDNKENGLIQWRSTYEPTHTTARPSALRHL
jgi:hypothetical protein